MHPGDKPIVSEFAEDELLYRRYLKQDFVNGQLLATAFQFPKQSFNRSQFSKPEDVLHIDCCGGRDHSSWGVLQCLAKKLPSPIDASNDCSYIFYMKHVPKPTCYAHCELWCNLQGSGSTNDYKEPSKTVKTSFRIALARLLSIRIEAKI